MDTPQFRLLLRHGKFGLSIGFVGLIILVAVVAVHAFRSALLADYEWGAVLSVPVTIVSMGLFSVLYEYYMRTTFARSMRSVFWAWDTGVTVFPSHSDAPDRKKVLNQARRRVRLMSTTFGRYFADVHALVEDKIADEGVKFQFILYDPSSKAIVEKAREEGCSPEDFKVEIHGTCRRDLGRYVKKYPDKIEVKFCDTNVPFGITIVDERLMVLSLNVFGLARSKNQTPCLVIDNTYEDDSVFKLYEDSFNAIWKRLPDTIPDELKRYFEHPKRDEETATASD